MLAYEILGLEGPTEDEAVLEAAYRQRYEEWQEDAQALAQLEAAYQWALSQRGASQDIASLFNDLDDSSEEAGTDWTDFDLEAWMASGLSGQFSQQVAQNRLAQNLAGVKAQLNDWSTWQQLLVDQANKDWQVPQEDFLLALQALPLESLENKRVLYTLLGYVPSLKGDPELTQALGQRVNQRWQELVGKPWYPTNRRMLLAGLITTVGSLACFGLQILIWLGIVIWPQAYAVWLPLVASNALVCYCFELEYSTVNNWGHFPHYLDGRGYRNLALSSLPLSGLYLATLVLGGLAVWQEPWLPAFGWTFGLLMVLVAVLLLAQRGLGMGAFHFKNQVYDAGQPILYLILAGLVLVTLVAWFLRMSQPNFLIFLLSSFYLYVNAKLDPTKKLAGRYLLNQVSYLISVSALLVAWRLYQGAFWQVPNIIWWVMALTLVPYLVGTLLARFQSREKE